MGKPRVLLKISGEALLKIIGKAPAKKDVFGYEELALQFVGSEIISAMDAYELAIVVGGGNIFRGAELRRQIGFSRPSSVPDNMGMLATIMNAILLQEFLEDRYSIETRVMSALKCNQVCEPYIPRRAASHLRKGQVVIFAGGIGKPNFSTDMAMVLNAQDVKADIVLKGTKVDGIYDGDPNTDASAKFLPEIRHMEYITRKLRIIDSTAVVTAMGCKMPLRVFDFFKKGNLKKALARKIGSIIH